MKTLMHIFINEPSMPNFIAITPEGHSRWWETYQLLKYNALQASIKVKQEFMGGFSPTSLGGLQHSPRNPSCIFCYPALLSSLSGQLPLPKINSCISPWVKLINSNIVENHLTTKKSHITAMMATQNLLQNYWVL